MRTRRTKEQIRKDNYNRDVDAYNFYVVNLDTMRAETGFEFKEDAVDLLNDYDDKKKYKVVSKRALKSMGIENPNESFKYEAGGDFQSGVYAYGGNLPSWLRDKQGKMVEKGKYVIIDTEHYNEKLGFSTRVGVYVNGLKVGVVQFDVEEEDYTAMSSKSFNGAVNFPYKEFDNQEDAISYIISKAPKSTYLEGGGYFDGSIPEVSTYMTNYAKGGGLESHGIKQGDTFLKTISGGIQQVKDKNGNIFYINLATGERSSDIPLPFANGGEIRRFDRHAQMDSSTREEIMDVIQDLEIRNPLTNYLYGLFDGYDYSKTKNFKIQMNKLRAKDFSLHKRIKEIYSKIDKYKFEKYNDFDKGGEVTYFINKDGIRVRSKVEPKEKLSEKEWMAKHNESKEARSYAFGGFFGKSNMESKPKKINLNDKQVRLNSGEYVQVLDQDGDTLMVMELSKIGTGASPKMVKISDVDMTSFATGGSVDVKKGAIKVGVFSLEDLKTDVFEKAFNKKSKETGFTNIDLKTINRGGKTFIEFYLIPDKTDSDVKIKDWYMKNYPTDDLGKELNDEVTFEDMWNEDYKKYDIYQVMGVGDSLIRERLFEHLAEIKGVSYDVVYRKLFSTDGFYATGGGVGLIGNQSKIDMNKNGRIDAEDFEIMRNTMNGAWRNERKHVNHNEDYEVRYARKKPSRTGYKGKRKFKDGGGISNFERLSRVVAKNYEGKRVKPQYQKEYGKVYSKSEAKEVGDKVAGKVKANQKMSTGGATKKGGQGAIMILAKKIRKDGEKWTDAVKRAGQQLK